MILDEAVDAAARVLYESGTKERFAEADSEDVAHMVEWARDILEAAAPHMLAGVEWGVFRASDAEEGTPIENLRYRSREAAQRSIDEGYVQPEFWEVRRRVVGEWSK